MYRQSVSNSLIEKNVTRDCRTLQSIKENNDEHLCNWRRYDWLRDYFTPYVVCHLIAIVQRFKILKDDLQQVVLEKLP